MDVIFDLDGTLADLTHRLHYVQKYYMCPECKAVTAGIEPCPLCATLTKKVKTDHKKFFEQVGGDALIPDVKLMMGILQDACFDVYIVSGRSDQCRAATMLWLKDNDISCHKLFMRRAGDYRSDSIVKQEILDTHWPGDKKKDIFAVFDDRNRVVEMWRQNGIRCYQVADGNF